MRSNPSNGKAMTAPGQARTSADVCSTSALPAKADMSGSPSDVADGPGRDIRAPFASPEDRGNFVGRAVHRDRAECPFSGSDMPSASLHHIYTFTRCARFSWGQAHDETETSPPEISAS